MSLITDAIVIGADTEQMHELNSALSALDGDRHQKFGQVPDKGLVGYAGGTKYFTEAIWIAAFNYIGRSEILEAVQIAWGGPQHGVIIVAKSAYSNYDWTVIMPSCTDDDDE